MTYRPPFARMRQIRRNAPPPLDKSTPINVEAAIAQAPESVLVVEEAPDEKPPTPAPAPPPMMGAVVKPSEAPVEEAPVEEAPVEEAPVEEEASDPDIIWSLNMRKAELIAIAKKMGVDTTDMTKKQIVAALDKLSQ